MNNYIVTNIFFEHKDIYKYTREEVISGKDKSIIDYVKRNKGFRRDVEDTRVNRSGEIYSDYYLVLSKILLSNLEREDNIRWSVKMIKMNYRKNENTQT